MHTLYDYDKYNYVYNKSIIYSSIYSHLVRETVARLEYSHVNGEQALRRIQCAKQWPGVAATGEQ